MARIAVGGFHHETNCFVPTRTDFAFFASHRDRPPLVRGPEVLEWQPAEQKILVLKSTVHFRADFPPIAEAVLVAVAPGGHIVDPTRYAYKRLRRGVRLYPLGPQF